MASIERKVSTPGKSNSIKIKLKASTPWESTYTEDTPEIIEKNLDKLR